LSNKGLGTSYLSLDYSLTSFLGLGIFVFGYGTLILEYLNGDTDIFLPLYPKEEFKSISFGFIYYFSLIL
jgi:hypothetical protein